MKRLLTRLAVRAVLAFVSPTVAHAQMAADFPTEQCR